MIVSLSRRPREGTSSFWWSLVPTATGIPCVLTPLVRVPLRFAKGTWPSPCPTHLDSGFRRNDVWVAGMTESAFADGVVGDVVEVDVFA